METVQGGHRLSLCWFCQNTNRDKCSWFDPDDPQPVPGWVAELRVKSQIGETFLVEECPNFDPIPERGPQHKATSGTDDCRGVYRGARHWVARINHKGQRYYLGYFKTKEKAIAARKAAEEAIARGEEPCKQ